MTDTVKFDPGIGQFVVDFNEFINDVYSQLMSFKTIHQKRARFKLYTTKITKYMKNNIAFYLGCIMWAYYIVNENKSEPKEIEGNPFKDYTKEQLEDYDYSIQTNFLENYFDSYERDYLYYTGKKTVIPEQWKNILSIYSEFLSLNNGFINIKKTSDLVLPERLKEINFNFDIGQKIKEAIEKEDLEILLNIDNLPI